MSRTEASVGAAGRSRPASPTIAGQLPLVATIGLSPLVGFLIGVALTPFFPAVARDLGTSVARLGQIPAASMLAAAGLGLVVGPLADHHGLRLLLLGSRWWSARWEAPSRRTTPCSSSRR